MKRRYKKVVICWLLVNILFLSSCSILSDRTSSYSDVVETSDSDSSSLAQYDSTDTAIIKEIDTENKSIKLYNTIKKRTYTLNYNGVTGVYDKYGSGLTMPQMSIGDIVDVKFLKDSKLLVEISWPSNMWEYILTGNLDINRNKGSIYIGDSLYEYRDDVMIISGDRLKQIDDINNYDSLIIKGIDKRVYSIIVDKGHGYLRLDNDEYFTDGWIEIGGKIIKKIEEGMLITVPEGIHDVYISKNSVQVEREVEIVRNDETVLDLSDVVIEDIIKEGTLLFTVSPSNATIYIDSKKIDGEKPYNTEYGIHQLMVKADGYKTVTRYIKVNEAGASIDVVLDKDTGNTSSNASVSGNSVNTILPPAPLRPVPSTSVSSNMASSSMNSVIPINTTHNINIKEPVGAEVYLDGNYLGIAPTSFKKEAGNYIVTLKKSGCYSRSYNIEITKNNTQTEYSFSNLTPVE